MVNSKLYKITWLVLWCTVGKVCYCSHELLLLQDQLSTLAGGASFDATGPLYLDEISLDLADNTLGYKKENLMLYYDNRNGLINGILKMVKFSDKPSEPRYTKPLSDLKDVLSDASDAFKRFSKKDKEKIQSLKKRIDGIYTLTGWQSLNKKHISPTIKPMIIKK